MGALLAFAPFIGFALVEKMLGIVPGLCVGTLISVALLARDRLQGRREINLLEAGSAVMFAALALLAIARGGDAWSLWQVRLWVDSGLLLLVLAGLIAKRPFTLHHARRRVSPEVAGSASFLRNNIVLSSVWTLCFAVLVAADLLMVLRPQTPVRLAIVLTVAALLAAARFTTSYATRMRREVDGGWSGRGR